MMDIRVAFDADNYLGETPIWSPAEQALWWVNVEQPPQLHRWEPASGAHRMWPMPARIGGFVPKAAGGLLVVQPDGVYDFDPETSELTLRAKSNMPPQVVLHECHCDRQGRLWVGAFDHGFPAKWDSGEGFFFRLDGDRLTPVIDKITVANGLAFSPDGRTMYFTSVPGRQVEAVDLDPATGDVSNRRVFIELGPNGYGDGATVDTQGGYWIALVGSGELRRYLPDGTLDRTINMPCSNPTKPGFGGADLATLYVTSTRMKINPNAAGNDANGAIFALEPGERGVPEVSLAG